VSQWYYSSGGATQGPVSDDELRSKLADGTITLDTQVVPVGQQTWVPLRNYAAQLGIGAAPSPSFAGPSAGFPPPPGGSPGGAAPFGGMPTPPPGFAAFPAAAGSASKAEWGSRAVAWLIDFGIFLGIAVVGWILAIVFGAVADALGALVLVVAYVGSFGFFIWNNVITQGRTGQTIGKKMQGIKLVRTANGQPIGPGMALVRYIVASLLASFTCGVYGLLDYLWPLWDAKKQRITDKIFNFDVVKA
jgi:uncharacterized RDD family membrane protein YckC